MKISFAQLLVLALFLPACGGQGLLLDSGTESTSPNSSEGPMGEILPPQEDTPPSPTRTPTTDDPVTPPAPEQTPGGNDPSLCDDDLDRPQGTDKSWLGLPSVYLPYGVTKTFCAFVPEGQWSAIKFELDDHGHLDASLVHLVVTLPDGTRVDRGKGGGPSFNLTSAVARGVNDYSRTPTGLYLVTVTGKRSVPTGEGPTEDLKADTYMVGFKYQ